MIFMNNVCMIDVVVFQNISILRKMGISRWRISDFCLGMRRIGNLEKENNFEFSGALSDQVLSLDTVVDGRD